MENHLTLVFLAGIVLALATANLIAGRLADAGFPVTPEANRIGCIDGLRGFLALAVMMHHFVIWTLLTRLGGIWTAPETAFFNQLGAGGVALFFMTTGLVFYPRVLTGFRACSWPAIYISRVFRIVPLIVVVTAIITAIVMWRTGRGLDAAYPKAALVWISTWAEPPLLGYEDSGRINAYVHWSLKYEWIFYILLLPLCALARDLTRDRLPSLVIPVGLLVASLVGRAIFGMHAFLSIMTFLPLFAIGMLAHELAARETIARALRGRLAGGIAVAALGLAMATIATPYKTALPAFAFFFLCVACGNDMFGLLRHKGALVLGECSYGIYLLHGIVLSLLFVEGAGAIAPVPTAWLPLLMPVAAAVVALIVPLTYLLVERPAMRLGRRLARSLKRTPVRQSV